MRPCRAYWAMAVGSEVVWPEPTNCLYLSIASSLAWVNLGATMRRARSRSSLGLRRSGLVSMDLEQRFEYVLTAFHIGKR